MKKRIERILALLLGLMMTCQLVTAETGGEDPLLQWQQEESQNSVSLTLIPTQQMKDNAVTTLQLTLQVIEHSGSVSQLTFSLDPEGAGAYAIAQTTYDPDTKELNLFLSQSQVLFDQTTLSCSVGTIKATESDVEFSLQPVALKTVDQSHETQEVSLLSDPAAPPFRFIPSIPTKPDTPQPEENTMPAEPKPEVSNSPEGSHLTSAPSENSAAAVIKELTQGERAEVIWTLSPGADFSEADQKAVLEALIGTGKALTLVVEAQNSMVYSLTFYGDQLSAESRIQDLGIQLSSDVSPAAFSLDPAAESLWVSVARSMTGMETVGLKINVNEYFTEGQSLIVYGVDAKDQLTLISQPVIVVDGALVFELSSSFSRYLVTTHAVEPLHTPDSDLSGADVGSPEDAPQSASGKIPWIGFLLAGVMGIAGVGLLLVVRRKHQE